MDRVRDPERAWIKAVIRKLWDYAHKRWIQRGKKLNGALNETPGKELQERIRALYKLQSQLPRRYQFFYRVQLEDMIMRETAKTRRWLHDAEPIILRAIRRQKQRRKERTGVEIWLRWEIIKKNRRKKMSTHR